MNQKFVVIINEKSSRSKPMHLIKLVKSIFPDADILVSSTKKNIQMYTQKKLKEGLNTFIVAGGDGTVSLVANYLVDKKCQLCIIPTGTRNDIASLLGIKDDPTKILENLKNKKWIIKKIDTINTNMGNFILNISVGLTSHIIHKSSSTFKKLLGPIAYYVVAGVEYLRSKEIDLDVTIDGINFKTKALDLLINNFGLENKMNIGSIAKARYDNGILECFIVKPGNVINHVSFFMGEKAEDIKHTIIKKEIDIKVKSEIPVQADGDVIKTKRIKARLNPKSLRIIFPG